MLARTPDDGTLIDLPNPLGFRRIVGEISQRPLLPPGGFATARVRPRRNQNKRIRREGGRIKRF